MLKIFEYKIFDVINKEENKEFLKKVKNQNPELYDRFISLIGNKGLDYAIEKYKEYDPQIIKEKEKNEKKLKKQKEIEDLKNSILSTYKKEIDYINSVNYTDLFDILVDIENNKLINNFIKEYKLKLKIIDYFSKLLKNPLKLKNLNIQPVKLSDLIFYKDDSSFIDFINISQNFHKSIYYNIYFNLPHSRIIDPFLPNSSREYIDENLDYVKCRNCYISSLSKYRIGEIELRDILFNKMTYYLSDEFYQKWKLKNISRKYNL